MYQDTVTIFNRKRIRNADVWYTTVITGCDFNADRGAIVAKYGVNSSDAVKLHVKYSNDGNVKKIANKTYLLPKEFQKIEFDGDSLASALFNARGTLDNYITFQQGDIIYLGEYDGTEINDTDYPKGFYNYLNKEFDNVYMISSAAEFSVIPHFEILAK